MLTERQRDRFLAQLETVTGVTDVYFFRDNLVVLNDYDLEAVESFLEVAEDGADIGLVLDSDTQEQLVV